MCFVKIPKGETSNEGKICFAKSHRKKKIERNIFIWVFSHIYIFLSEFLEKKKNENGGQPAAGFRLTACILWQNPKRRTVSEGKICFAKSHRKKKIERNIFILIFPQIHIFLSEILETSKTGTRGQPAAGFRLTACVLCQNPKRRNRRKNGLQRDFLPRLSPHFPKTKKRSPSSFGRASFSRVRLFKVPVCLPMHGKA